MGVILLALCVVGGAMWAQPALRVFFDYDGPMLGLLVIAYGFAAPSDAAAP